MIKMTVVTTDVNQAFAAEKADQIAGAHARVEANQSAIAAYDSGLAQKQLDEKLAADVASGKIRMAGDDRYEVLEGWDRNEYFRVQRATRPGELALVLPETGLDVLEDGRSALYTAVPSWHQTEGVGYIEDGTTDIATVLDRGGISWMIMQEPVCGAITGEVPGAFINYRSDTRAPLGVVGKIYTPAQPREQLSFLQDLAERYDVPFETAGPLNGGKQVFVSMRIPDSIKVDVDGINETIELFLMAFNDNSGNGKLRVVATPWRPLCGNTNRFALRDAVASWGTRHTRNWKDRVAEAQRHLGLVTTYGEHFAAEETQLARTAASLSDVEALMNEIWEKPGADATKRTRLAHERRLDTVFERFGMESARVGKTAYAAENAITGFLDHDKNRNAGQYVNMAAARATASLLGADDDIKTHAHRQLLTLVNR